MIEKLQSCPHVQTFDEAAASLQRIIPQFLSRVGVGDDKSELTIVIRSRVCGCVAIIAESQECAHAAASELLKVTAESFATDDN